MSDLPNPEDEIDRPYETREAEVGRGADGGTELGDDVAQQAATGITGPGADELAAAEAPASEGELDGDA